MNDRQARQKSSFPNIQLCILVYPSDTYELSFEKARVLQKCTHLYSTAEAGVVLTWLDGIGVRRGASMQASGYKKEQNHP